MFQIFILLFFSSKARTGNVVINIIRSGYKEIQRSYRWENFPSKFLTNFCLIMVIMVNVDPNNYSFFYKCCFSGPGWIFVFFCRFKAENILVRAYGPISVLPVVSEVIERVVFKHLCGYLNEQPFNGITRSELRPIFFTETTILEETNESIETLNGLNVSMA